MVASQGSNQGKLKRNEAVVLGLLMSNLETSEIAKRFEVSETAVRAFRRRHADVLVPAKLQVVTTVLDVAIRNKEERIRRLAAIATDMHKLRTSGEVEGARNVAALAREERAAYRDVAEELGQLPKGDVNIDARTQVLIRSYDTWPEQLK